MASTVQLVGEAALTSNFSAKESKKWIDYCQRHMGPGVGGWATDSIDTITQQICYKLNGCKWTCANDCRPDGRKFVVFGVYHPDRDMPTCDGCEEVLERSRKRYFTTIIGSDGLMTIKSIPITSATTSSTAESKSETNDSAIIATVVPSNKRKFKDVATAKATTTATTVERENKSSLTSSSSSADDIAMKRNKPNHIDTVETRHPRRRPMYVCIPDGVKWCYFAAKSGSFTIGDYQNLIGLCQDIPELKGVYPLDRAEGLLEWPSPTQGRTINDCPQVRLLDEHYDIVIWTSKHTKLGIVPQKQRCSRPRLDYDFCIKSLEDLMSRPLERVCFDKPTILLGTYVTDVRWTALTTLLKELGHFVQ